VRQKIAVAFPRNAEGAEDILTLVALAKIVLAVEYAKLDYGVIRAIIQALILKMKWQLSAEEVAFLTLNWRQNSMQNLNKKLLGVVRNETARVFPSFVEDAEDIKTLVALT